MFCIHCGKEIEDGSKFCGYCGKPLGEEAGESPAEPVEETSASTAPVSDVEEAKENAEPIKETPAETVPVSAIEETKETAEPVKETPAETAPVSAVEETKETAGLVEETSAETVPESAVEEAKENLEKAVEAVNETVESAAEALREAAGETAEAPAEAAVKPEEKTESLSAPEELPVEKEGGAKALDIRALVKNKTVLLIAAALAALVLLVVIAVVSSVSASSGGTGIKGSYLLHEDNGESIVIYNGKKIKSLDLSTNAYVIAESLDGSKAIVRDGVSALYYLDNGNSSNITGDFDAAWITLSDDGSTAAYHYDGSLYLYKGGNKKKVADIENMLCALVLSPNGDTIAYAESDGDKISTYAYKGGKVIDLDAKVTPLTVSNGGGIIYGYDKKSRLCFIKNLKPDSAESVKNLNLIAKPVFSTDKKQILFASDNGMYYFDSSHKEDIKVTGSKIMLIYPECGVRSYDNLKSFLAYSDSKIVKFTRKGDDFDKETLASSPFSCILSADGKELVYVQNNELYKISVSNPDKKTQLGSEVIDYYADKDLKNVYFLNQDNTLRYADGKSKNGKKIIDDVGDFNVAPNGVCIFTDDDDTLYYSANGSDKKKAGLEDVTGYVERTYNTIYVESDGDLYVSTDGKNFSKP